MSRSGVESIRVITPPPPSQTPPTSTPLINDVRFSAPTQLLRLYSTLGSAATTPRRPPPLFTLQRHHGAKWMHLNISADTNNKCTNKDSNIESEREKKKDMPARNINSPSVIHRLCVFIYSFSLQPGRCLEGRPLSCL